MSAAGPVMIVVGTPDDTLLAGLRSVGLQALVEDGEVVVWAQPRRHSLPPPPGGSAADGSDRTPLMSVAEAALAAGVGRGTVYELIGRGELDVFHVGRNARVPVAAVRELAARLQAEQASSRTESPS